MTPKEFKAARHSLGLSVREMGIALGLRGSDVARKVRSYEDGDSEISGPVHGLVLAMLNGFRPPWFPHSHDLKR